MSDSDNVNIQNSGSESTRLTPDRKTEVKKLPLPESPSQTNVLRQSGNISPHTPQEQDPAVALGILRRPRGSMIERPASLDAHVPRRVKRLSSLL
jgi:hypothetical protein